MSALPGLAGQHGRTLAQRLGLTFLGIGVAVAVVASVAGWAYVNQLSARQRVLGVIDPARLDAANLLTDYVNEETGVRGYVLTADSSFLQPYQQAAASVTADHRRLVSDLSSDPSAVRFLAGFEAATSTWERTFAQPAIAATKAHSRTYRSTASELEGKRLFDDLRAQYSKLDIALEAERKAAIATLSDAQDLFLGLLVGSAAVLLLAGIAAWRALRAWVTSPLRALGNDARIVSVGNLDHAVLPVGPPDIALLALDVDEMRRRILEEVELVDQARNDLEESNADLARSNVELEQFAYVASHDLQEPLRKVVSFCQLLQRRYQGQLDERADEYIGFAVDGASRMQVLINDLLAFSRVGRASVEFREVELVRAANQAVGNLEQTIEEAGARVEIGTLPTVDGDPTLLTALFQNLIGNAIKFREEAAPVVTITSALGPQEWQFAIADNGIGIEPRFADRVFVIFQRLHARDVYSGTGIGLALCKKIVEFHGGRIWIDTKYHPGTRICWTLPAKGRQ